MTQSLEKQFPLIPKEQFKQITALDPTFNEEIVKGNIRKYQRPKSFVYIKKPYP